MSVIITTTMVVLTQRLRLPGEVISPCGKHPRLQGSQLPPSSHLSSSCPWPNYDFCDSPGTFAFMGPFLSKKKSSVLQLCWYKDE